MRYKKDMMFILIAVLILGAAIQTIRTDLISILSAEKRPPEKAERYYAVDTERQIGIEKEIGAKYPVFYEIFNSLKAQ